jgi:hypothetical protein
LLILELDLLVVNSLNSCTSTELELFEECILCYARSTGLQKIVACSLFLSPSPSLFVNPNINSSRMSPSLLIVQVVAAMCSKVPFISSAIMKATNCGMYSWFTVMIIMCFSFIKR